MIPVEIIDHILSFLRPDFKTLKICSTVFPQLADRHLYSHVSLCTSMASLYDDEVFYRPKFLDFVHQVKQHPHTLLSVQSIRVIVKVYPLAPLEHHIPNFLSIISKFLPAFSKLQSIDLQAWAPFSWDTLKPDFSAGLQKCLQSPLINQVSIHNISRFPLDLFDDCQNLKKLVLKGDFTGVSTSSYPPLSSLHIDIPFGADKSPAHLPKIVSWMNSRTLQSLSLCIHQCMLSSSHKSIDLQPLIEACAPTLLTLDLSFCDGGELRFILFYTQLIRFFFSS